MSRIRRVDASDTEAVVALWREVFPEYNDLTRPQRDPHANIARKLAFGDGLFWLVQIDTRIVATAMAGYDGHRGWIYSVAVAPAHRRHGVGSKLVAYAERALAAKGCVKVNLQIMEGNEAVSAFYASLGFSVEKRISMGKRISENIPK